MVKKKRPERARTLRRCGERKFDKLVSARRKLIALEPGGSPERPLEVASASVVEPRAEAFACPECGAALRCREHRAELVQGKPLRIVDLTCRTCASELTLYFRVIERVLN